MNCQVKDSKLLSQICPDLKKNSQIILKKHRKTLNKIKKMMHEQNGNIIKETEMDMSQTKEETKILLEGLSSRCDQAKNRISEFEGRT